MHAFLSHISEEALAARAIKESLEAALPGVEVFVSAADIHLGDAWLREIDEALTDARVVLTLCSQNSIRRPWLNFESGSGWTRRIPVIPICYKGLRKEQLPDPLGIFQAIELKNAASCQHLIERLASILGQPVEKGYDPKEILQAMQVKLPSRTRDIGIVLCHHQDEWEKGGRSVLALPKPLPEELYRNWNFCELDDKRIFMSSSLHELSGLILASPWRAKMDPEIINAIVEWVRAGGRLLLLGFELGDRHHDGNLAELSHYFGIDPAGNIVGPKGFGNGKPYGEPVDFSPSAAEEHMLTKGLTSIRLTNVQTVQVDPGGTEWLRVGSNIVYRPRRDSIEYHGGTMTTPRESIFELNKEAGWLPVAVEAPQGLCGRGSVHMIGTWDLLGRNQTFAGDNLNLLIRLLDWLSGKNA